MALVNLKKIVHLVRLIAALTNTTSAITLCVNILKLVPIVPTIVVQVCAETVCANTQNPVLHARKIVVPLYPSVEMENVNLTSPV